MINTMDSQNYLNVNNMGLIQQPVPVNHGMMSMPAAPQTLQQPYLAPPMNPTMAPVAQLMPMPTQIPIINVYQNVPANTDLWIFTPHGRLERGIPAQYCQLQDGNFVAPQGWSLMPREEFFRYSLNVQPFPSNVAPLRPSPSPSVASRSPSLDPNVLSARSVNTEHVESSKKANPKRPHRAKQIKITKIHTIVRENCVRKGIFADEKEVLRGPDVLRIHVKTWEGLDMIEDVLEEVENAVPVARIALPFSMKNKFQKKGFICYLKVQDEAFVPTVQSIFGRYTDAFKKCDVALPTNRDPVSKMNEADMKNVIVPADFGMAPPTMAKRLSAA